MNSVYIRRSIGGKSFAASTDPNFDLTGRKCPFTGEGFEDRVKEVTADNAEINGVDFLEALAGAETEGIYFGKFKVNLGETLIMS